MNYTILYPADFFNVKKIDTDYEYEYIEAIKFPDFQIVFFNYDEFLAGNKLECYPENFEKSLCIYRGWMLQSDKYQEFYIALQEKGLNLINTPMEYQNCHEFPNAYPLIMDFTPQIKVYKKGECINWNEIKTDFKRFLLKDYVKSVKGTDFPIFFDSSYSNDKLDGYLNKFIEMRGNLFVKGIVLKEYLNLKKRAGITNEYRAFYLYGKLLSLSKNSNQETDNSVPISFVESLPQLKSNFYTIDFAELDSGKWIVIETGDGQVSGLSPRQYVFKYYEKLLNILQHQ